jgi:uncharacterized coiled-coil protein SlyX
MRLAELERTIAAKKSASAAALADVQLAGQQRARRVVELERRLADQARTLSEAERTSKRQALEIVALAAKVERLSERSKDADELRGTVAAQKKELLAHAHLRKVQLDRAVGDVTSVVTRVANIF